MLEVAADTYGVLSDALESGFRFKPNNPAEEAYLNRLNMYFSAFSLFQSKLQDAMTETIGLLLACASAGLLIYTTEANYQYQQDKTAQSRIERINQNRRELAAALH